jgi:hypothetical protein
MRFVRAYPDPDYCQQGILVCDQGEDNTLLFNTAYNLGPNSWQSVNTSKYKQFSSKWNWSLNSYNNLAIFIHFINALVLLVLCFTYLDSKPENVVFVSGEMELQYTNYALIDINNKETCDDVKHYSNQYKELKENQLQNLIVLKDLMPHNLYDFSNKTIVKYNIPEYNLSTHYMIAFFFILSFLFQSINGMYLGFEASFPRIMYYLEYSVSASLMIVVLAINVGILEAYTLLAFAAIFFGMNILGACAETISWMNAKLFQNKSMKFGWLLPHIASWILFFIVYIPILVTYEKVRSCSSASAPGFVTAAIYVEFLFFCLFGLAQTYFLAWRSIDHNANVEWYIDFVSITLSIISKTFLAWILIGPVLSAYDVSDVH